MVSFIENLFYFSVSSLYSLFGIPPTLYLSLSQSVNKMNCNFLLFIPGEKYLILFLFYYLIISTISCVIYIWLSACLAIPTYSTSLAALITLIDHPVDHPLFPPPTA